MKETGKIKDEFGFSDEAEAVKEYSALNRDFMHTNYPLIADEIISRLNLTRGLILDIGTGLGSLAIEFAKRLPESKVYGLDISQEMLAEARKSALEQNVSNLEFIPSSVENMDFKESYFDLVVSFGVLHHLEDLRSAFLEVKRILKEGGVAYIYDLRKDAPEEIVFEISSGMSPLHKKALLESVKTSLDLTDLKKILESANFTECSLSYPKFLRSTIIKNKELLRKSRFVGDRFNKILVECCLRK